MYMDKEAHHSWRHLLLQQHLVACCDDFQLTGADWTIRMRMRAFLVNKHLETSYSLQMR